MQKHYFCFTFHNKLSTNKTSSVPTHSPSVYFHELECVQRIVGHLKG